MFTLSEKYFLIHFVYILYTFCIGVYVCMCKTWYVTTDIRAASEKIFFKKEKVVRRKRKRKHVSFFTAII